MTLLPKSMLWRTVLLIAVLLLASQLATLRLFGVSERAPRAKQIAQQLVSVVNLTRTSLLTSQKDKRRLLLEQLSQREGIQVYPAEEGETAEPLPDRPILHMIAREVRQQLGEDTQLTLRRAGMPSIWVSFHIDGDKYWVSIPRAKIDRPFPWVWVGWGALGLVLSILGAYLIVSRINRPLRSLAQAAAEVGKGNLPEKMNETGPEEIRAVISAFNQMAQDVKQLADDRNLLLAGVSHDLRTPLTRMRLSVEMLGDSVPESTREGMIQDMADMDGIIGQFLDFVREGENEPQQQGDLNQLVQSVVERYIRAGKDVKMDLGKLAPFHYRPMAIQRGLTNLIDNALRYGGGEVVVATSSENGFVRISVSDNGPGIPESEIPRLMQPFSRLDKARGSSHGAGLGLAIVSRIAEQHQGRFNVLNRSQGGLEARLEIPRS